MVDIYVARQNGGEPIESREQRREGRCLTTWFRAQIFWCSVSEQSSAQAWWFSLNPAWILKLKGLCFRSFAHTNSDIHGHMVCMSPVYKTSHILSVHSKCSTNCHFHICPMFYRLLNSPPHVEHFVYVYIFKTALDWHHNRDDVMKQWWLFWHVFLFI